MLRCTGQPVGNEYGSTEKDVMEDRPSNLKAEDRLLLGFVVLFSLVTAIYPTVRAFYHFEVNYPEGWNIYNAVAVAHHVRLYGAKYGWTTVNYPPLSYYIVSRLSHLTHGYLLAGRLLSLVSVGISCLLVGFIVKKLTGNSAAALFGGFFCLALFCAAAPAYVGEDDPQVFAQVFFLSGLLLYVSRPPTLKWVVAIALLFAVGGNVKHNLIDFPLAVFLDLCLVSRRKAIQFIFFLGILAGISLAVNTWAEGPFFVSNLLAGRSYSLVRAMLDFASEYLPILFPLIAAWIWAARERNSAPNRLLSFLFFFSLLIGIALGGGQGVSLNAYFDNFLAMSMITGVLFHTVSETRVPCFNRFRLQRWGFASLTLASLILVLFFFGDGLFWRRLEELPQEQGQFDREVSFLANRPGPAICESLLRCYDAGKPYVYDPFNSQRLMRAGKLDSNVIVAKIAARQFASIQISFPVKSFDILRDQLPRTGFHPVRYAVIQLGPFGALRERFPDTVLDAIDTYYKLSVEDPDCDIYVPRSDGAAARIKPSL